ncbi:DNA polymerase subunit beta [Paenibacillus timonensis]|nr:nucleotidyltransferase domain-containing protein [Paenibacillus timonensis]MUG85459.1 DNA polymerase subunit beta [Paenibacillus timonensis]
MSIEHILERIVNRLQGTEGLQAIVLGGSRATNTHRPDSDIDIGLYYEGENGLDITGLGQIATELDDQHRNDLLTGIGEWGPGVNGGGWLVIGGYHVDFLYRDMTVVRKAVEDCCGGIVQMMYQTGHPHAFLNSIYMGEVAVCRILWEREDRLTRLKNQTHPYPPLLREGMLRQFLFEAGFSLMLMESSADRDDISYVTGHAFRSVSSLNQALYALNGRYCLNEKKAVRNIQSFDIRPESYKDRLDLMYGKLGPDPKGIRESIHELRTLLDEVNELAKTSTGEES